MASAIPLIMTQHAASQFRFSAELATAVTKHQAQVVLRNQANCRL
jgi:hypothetical protein